MKTKWGTVILCAITISCGIAQAERIQPMKIALIISAFTEGKPIPKKHTCEGPDVSPALKWDNVPDGTKSIALIMDDPDAPKGIWVHWVLWNLPASTRELVEGIPSKATLPNGTEQGINDFKLVGYNGPCPPPGKPHRYYFKLYALDSTLDLKEGEARKEQLVQAMKGHVLAEGQLMGTYQR